LSFSLKLYSGLLLLWLLVDGAKAALYAAGIALVVLSFALPVALFGAGQTISLYGSWFKSIAANGRRWSLHLSCATRRTRDHHTQAGDHGIDWQSGARANHAMAAGPVVGDLACRAWWYAARAFGSGYVVAPSRAALADWTILILAPLPISPWLEPYHALPILPGTILYLVVVLDERAADADRTIVFAALSGLLLTQIVRIPLPIRGLELLAQRLVLVISLGLIRLRLTSVPDHPHLAVMP
jgi:hypothetical protein